MRRVMRWAVLLVSLASFAAVMAARAYSGRRELIVYHASRATYREFRVHAGRWTFTTIGGWDHDAPITFTSLPGEVRPHMPAPQATLPGDRAYLWGVRSVDDWHVAVWSTGVVALLDVSGSHFRLLPPPPLPAARPAASTAPAAVPPSTRVASSRPTTSPLPAILPMYSHVLAPMTSADSPRARAADDVARDLLGSFERDSALSLGKSPASPRVAPAATLPSLAALPSLSAPPPPPPRSPMSASPTPSWLRPAPSPLRFVPSRTPPPSCEQLALPPTVPLVVTVLPGAWIAAAGSIRTVCRRSRRRRGLCLRCGYDLRGAMTTPDRSGVCPECGTPVPASRPSPGAAAGLSP